MTKYIDTQMFQQDQAKLIRIRQVIDMTGLSRSYIYGLAASGKFPRSVSLVPGGTSKAWIISEVQDWVNQRIAERNEEV